MMPRLNGFAVLRQLRATAATAAVPVILLSARAGEEARLEGLAAGADDYLVKPFHARELVARVEATIRLATERRTMDQQRRQAAIVFENTGEAIIVADSDRNIVAVNEAFCTITGFDRDDVIGRNPRLLQSGRHDDAFYRAIWQALDSGGQWQGEIWNRRRNGEVFAAWENISAVRDPRGRITDYVSIFSDISHIKAAEERISRLAHQDALTGLPNRLLFTARLEQALERETRHGRKVGLLLLDLDRFKLVNDTLGHAAGDKLLQTVAHRIMRGLREQDTVARLGGDEFAIVLDELDDPSDAAVVAMKIGSLLTEPVVLEGRQLVVSASIGISLYPDDASTGEDLVKAADAAMYRGQGPGAATPTTSTPPSSQHGRSNTWPSSPTCAPP